MTESIIKFGKKGNIHKYLNNDYKVWQLIITMWDNYYKGRRISATKSITFFFMSFTILNLIPRKMGYPFSEGKICYINLKSTRNKRFRAVSILTKQLKISKILRVTPHQLNSTPSLSFLNCFFSCILLLQIIKNIFELMPCELN